MSSPIRYARALRQNMTPEEKLLWIRLRNSNWKGLKVRRQHPIVYKTINGQQQFYVADFYIAQFRLVIELDGKHHEFGDQKTLDEVRDLLLSGLNMRVLRIRNEEVRQDINLVLKRIEDALS